MVISGYGPLAPVNSMALMVHIVVEVVVTTVLVHGVSATVVDDDVSHRLDASGAQGRGERKQLLWHFVTSQQQHDRAECTEWVGEGGQQVCRGAGQWRAIIRLLPVLHLHLYRPVLHSASPFLRNSPPWSRTQSPSDTVARACIPLATLKLMVEAARRA